MTEAAPLSPTAPGRFITLEGGEGAGKSTQVRRLVQALRDRGIAVLATREPGGAPGAEEIRRLLVEGGPERWDAMTEALLHFAARREHLRTTIRPALGRGVWVVSDRFADSTMAYQGYGHGLGRETILALQGLAIGAVKPDLTVILDLPVEHGLARAEGRSGAETRSETRYERMDRGFHERLRAGFLAIAQAEPDRCVVVDAAAPEEEVAEAILAAVARRIGLPAAEAG